MATAESDYHRGDQNIAEQERTFSGFVTVTVWGSALTALIVFYLTLVFAAGFGWLTSFVGVFVLGVVIGLLLKLKGAWYATLVVLSVITMFSGGFYEILNRFVL